MVATLQDLLMPPTILDVVSRVRKGQGMFSRWLGLHQSGFDDGRGVLVGPALEQTDSRYGTYFIYDRTRTVAQARSPNTPPATISPKPVGRVSYAIPRFHEKIRLEAELLAHLGTFGPNVPVKDRGRDYVGRVLDYMAQRMNNTVELMVAAVLRGHIFFRNSGDDWFPTLTAPAAGVPSVDVNYQLFAGNQNQLNMLGAGNIITVSWADPNAPIVSNDLPKIAEAMAKLSGYALTDAWVGPTVWGQIITNTEVIQTAGSANQPFEYQRFENTPGGAQANQWVSVLRGYPTIRWHVGNDYFIADGNLDPTPASTSVGTLTPVIPDNTVVFTPEPSPEWIDGLWYAEYVSEQVGMPARPAPSYYTYWNEWITQPSTVELIGLMNFLPRLRIPKALVSAVVIF